jgi:hypothetical protein
MMILSGGFGNIVGRSRVKTQEAYQTIFSDEWRFNIASDAIPTSNPSLTPGVSAL